MESHWIRTNGKLWNLEMLQNIDEPIFVNGTNAPGYWVINYSTMNGLLNMWTYPTEQEARDTFDKIEKILTKNYNFIK